MSAPPDAAGPFDGRAFARALTHRPGVYRMFDGDGRVLYVGKARDLQRRVASYFGRRAHDGKTWALLQATAAMDVTVTATELEALLLEYNLIKEHRPRYNVVLRDDKSYPYIHVTTEQEFPRFEFHRGSRNVPGRFFGPYPNAGAVRETLQQLQRLFRVRQCQDSFFAHRTRPCLQHQIDRCTAPCVGLVGAQEYRADVDNAMRFLEGRSDDLAADLVARMEKAAAATDYERAAAFRDQLAAIKKIRGRQSVAARSSADADVVVAGIDQGHAGVVLLMVRGGRVLGSRSYFPAAAAGTSADEVLDAFLGQHYLAQAPPGEIIVARAPAGGEDIARLLGERSGYPVALRTQVRGTRRRWLEMARQTLQQALASRVASGASRREQLEALGALLGLAEAPGRVECFDISHTGGTETVASCVVFGEEGPRKSDYRRFNIRDVAAGDDYAAIGQAVFRRYARVRAGEAPVPDLILIDGGRGQLAAAHRQLEELQLGDVPLAAIAKGPGRVPGRETIHVQGRDEAIGAPAAGPAMHLLQQVRDEAHRFAITGHRQRRGKERRRSLLEGIPGLGPARRRALLQHFGGGQGVTRAGIDDLAAVPGISRRLAERVYLALQDGDGPPPAGAGTTRAESE